MRKWWSQWLLESRWIWNHPIIVMLPPLYGIWMVVQLWDLSPPVSQDVYMYMVEFHQIHHTLSLGIAMLTGLLLVRKDLVRPAYEWLGGLPVSPGILLSAKFMAGFLYLTAFTGSMAAVSVYFFIRREVPASLFAETVLHYALSYEMSYAVTLALGMTLGVLIPNRISYLIGFGAWMFGTFFLDIFIISMKNWYFLKTFHLNQFFLNDALEHEVWGRAILGEETVHSRRFVLAFIVFLLVLSATVVRFRIPAGRMRKWVLCLLASIMACTLLFVPYAGLWKDRYAAWADKKESARENWHRAESAVISYKAYRYQLDVERTGTSGILVNAAMFVPTPERESGSFFLTLNRIFHIREMRINGKRVPFEREEDLVSIPASLLDPQRNEQRIGLTYEGKVAEWSHDGRREFFEAFIRGNHVYLPDHFAWYPLPGRFPLYLHRAGGLSPFPVRDYVSGADFDIRLTGFSDKIYTNLDTQPTADDNRHAFSGKNVRGVNLWGGPFMEIREPHDPFTIVTTPSNKREAEHFLREVLKRKTYFKKWVDGDLDRVKQVVYFPFQSLTSSLLRHDDVLVGNAFVIRQSRHHNLDPYQRNQTVNAFLFGDPDIGPSYAEEEGDSYSLSGEIRQLFRYLYYRDAEGLTHREIAAMHDSQLYILRENKPEEVREMVHLVDHAIYDGNVELVRNVLNHFYRKGLSLPANPDRPIRITYDEWRRVWETHAKSQETFEARS